MKKVVITGVAGFVGSNLAIYFIKNGWDVVGIDNLSFGYLDNLDEVITSNRFLFVNADVRDEKQIEDVMKGSDAVVHLAAYKIPRYGNALKTIQVNTHGTQIVLNIAEKIGAKFVLASTSDVFGKNPSLPFSESSDLYLGAPTVKRWAYAISKLYDEHLCLAKSQEKAMCISIMRYFGGYGPRENLSWWGGPQSVFIEQIIAKKPLTIHGDGLQTRTFTYVDDMVDATARIVENDNANGEIFNVGQDYPVSILNLAHVIWNLMHPGVPPDIVHVPYSTFGRYEDVRHRIPDTRKAELLLNFKAKVDLSSGLSKTILWHQWIREKRNLSDDR